VNLWRNFGNGFPNKHSTPSLLFVISLFVSAHYCFGESVLHPDVFVWKYPAFWRGLLSILMIVHLHVLIWFSFAPLIGRSVKFILLFSWILIAGDLIWLCIDSCLVHLFHSPIPGLWKWWGWWEPTIIVLGNLILCVKALARTSIVSRVRKYFVSLRLSPVEIRVRICAFFMIVLAFTVTSIQMLLPRLPVGETSLILAKVILVRNETVPDLVYLASDPRWFGRRLGDLIQHVELARIQKQQFYSQIDLEIFRRYVLSPRIGEQPVSEFGWRRDLWLTFYPRVRNQREPLPAAKIVVRTLRERVGISADRSSFLGIQTIWRLGMANQEGFNRVYVAALRAVGIASRLDPSGEPEIWTGLEWAIAPTYLLNTL
jgi:hypothetical protein